jgi:hypothetical protein
MDNSMRLSEYLIELGRPVAYYPSLAKLLGVKATVFICQLAYWHGKQADPEGWIYKTSDELEEETGLSYYEQKSARKELRARGMLEEKYRRLDHQMYYRVLWDVLNEFWSSSRTCNSNAPECDKTSFGNEEVPHSLNESETTTQTTTEIKKGVNFDFQKSDLGWAVAAGEDIPAEQLAALQAERALLDEYERAMNYPPLPWDKPKLDKLRRFLVSKPVEEIRKFAEWSKRPYSDFSPTKARSYPDQVKDNWLIAQAWTPKGNGRGGVDPVDEVFAKLIAERDAVLNGNA